MLLSKERLTVVRVCRTGGWSVFSLALCTQDAVMALSGVSSAAQAPLGRSGIKLQLLSIIVPTTALQRGWDRKCILKPVAS